MADEDKKTALSMYERMFDMSSDEAMVLNKLVSPTRQAVNIARVYDAASRKKAILEGNTETPPFVDAINKIANSVIPEKTELSTENIQETAKESASAVTESVLAEDKTGAAEIPEPEIKEAEKEIPQTPVYDTVDMPTVEEASSIDSDIKAAEDRVTAAVVALAQAVNAAGSEGRDLSQIADNYQGTPVQEEVPVDAEKREITDAPEIGNRVDEFVGGMEISDDISRVEQNAAEAPALVEETAGELPRRLRPGLLVLFILIAVPVCAVLIIFLLALAAVFISAAVAIGQVAILGIGSAFGSYSVFADILVVVGSSVILLALAVLLAWTGIWFVAGVAVSLVKGVLRLADRWCYREVKA